VHIESIEVATGKRSMLLEYVPMDLTGIHYVDTVLSADGKRAIYGLRRFLTSLQVVNGLK
jgi:hypothetical protein